MVVLTVWLCHVQVSVLASCPLGSAAGLPPPLDSEKGLSIYFMI
jgi:hypothetical protein